MSPGPGPASAYAPDARPAAAPDPVRTPEPEPPRQQPSWQGHHAYARTMNALAAVPPLTTVEELAQLSAGLAEVAAGRAAVLQLGDCAESFHESTVGHVQARLALLERLADDLAAQLGRPVLRIGRLAGQYAKPRSRDTELVDGVELPAFRGHMVNSEEPTPAGRQHEPRRMLWAYTASARTMAVVRQHRAARTATGRSAGTGPWTSHEALVLDYEHSLVRPAGRAGQLLSSTHLPWVGERTRQLDSAHLRLMAGVVNPVACKVSGTISVEEVVRLAGTLDPERIPGRLVLIARMGHAVVRDRLPVLVRAVRNAGHPVVWLTDPMHGNTVTTGDGLKTRHLEQVVAEATGFCAVLEAHGVVPGGLHLEVAPDPVTECVDLGGDTGEVGNFYTTLCDPRLNPEQTGILLDAWAAG